MRAAEISSWAIELEPDFRGQTASGAFMTLFTWKVDDSPFYALGFHVISQEDADENGRVAAIKTMLANA